MPPKLAGWVHGSSILDNPRPIFFFGIGEGFVIAPNLHQAGLDLRLQSDLQHRYCEHRCEFWFFMYQVGNVGGPENYWKVLWFNHFGEMRWKIVLMSAI